MEEEPFEKKIQLLADVSIPCVLTTSYRLTIARAPPQISIRHSISTKSNCSIHFFFLLYSALRDTVFCSTQTINYRFVFPLAFSFGFCLVGLYGMHDNMDMDYTLYGLYTNTSLLFYHRVFGQDRRIRMRYMNVRTKIRKNIRQYE